MPLSVAPIRLQDAGDARELRLAVVCYGGVSLAIYMHGITRELQSLVDASVAYEGNAHENPFDPATQTEHAYWQALKAAQAADPDRVRTRVVLDVIAGTSAGGINGVVLAKGLACGASQQGLRDVWLNEGDLKVLLASPIARRMPGLKAKAAVVALGVVLRGRTAPLSGKLLLTQVYGALQKMRSRGEGGGIPWPVELHVTMTDFTGYALSAPAWDPKTVKDLRHRHVLRFRSDRGHFAARYDRALAFAARATSSFPGAFPPVRIGDITSQLDGGGDPLAAFPEDAWADYTVSQGDAQNSVFVDGGVLDNAPFGLAIQGIQQRPAGVEVDRRLLFIQPDPHDPEVPLLLESPTVVQTVWGGLSKIPRAEPVLDDLLDVRAINERVERARTVVDAVEAVADAGGAAVPALDAFAGEDAQAHDAAGEQLGASVIAYRRLKLYSVVDELAGLAARVANLPPLSNQAFLVKDVLVAWATSRGLLSTAPERWVPDQLPFLRAFDLAYAERRVRFVIRRLNRLYPDPEQGAAAQGDLPDRAALDKAKLALYQRLYTLTQAREDAIEGPAAQAAGQLFGATALAPYLALPGDPADAVAAFVADRGAALDELREALATVLTERLGTFGQDTYAALLSATEGWPAGPRARLVSAYVRFPLWDALLFPIGVFGEAGELDPVEVLRVSPLDVHLLTVPGSDQYPPPVADKLKGVAAGHFGAFFEREWRENDYLWGRLDGVERLLRLLVDDPKLSAAGFAAVLESEAASLREIPATYLDGLRAQVAALASGTPVA